MWCYPCDSSLFSALVMPSVCPGEHVSCCQIKYLTVKYCKSFIIPSCHTCLLICHMPLLSLYLIDFWYWRSTYYLYGYFAVSHNVYTDKSFCNKTCLSFLGWTLSEKCFRLAYYTGIQATDDLLHHAAVCSLCASLDLTGFGKADTHLQNRVAALWRNPRNRDM